MLIQQKCHVQMYRKVSTVAKVVQSPRQPKGNLDLQLRELYFFMMVLMATSLAEVPVLSSISGSAAYGTRNLDSGCHNRAGR